VEFHQSDENQDEFAGVADTIEKFLHKFHVRYKTPDMDEFTLKMY
jgi:hypothetical protein